MIWIRLTSLTLLFQSIGYAVSPSMRGAFSDQGEKLTLRKLQTCSEHEINMKIIIDFTGNPQPWINYVIYHNNGKAIFRVKEYLDISTEDDTFYEGNYCLVAKECYTLWINELGRWDYNLAKRFDHYPVKVELDDEKIIGGKATHQQYFKIGNCTSHTCDEGEAMLTIQKAGRVSDDPRSPSFNYSVYNGSGELLEIQQERYASNIEGLHYFCTFLWLNLFNCYTIYIAKDVAYQVNFSNFLIKK